MSHGPIIIERVILPPPDSQVAAVDGTTMKARIEYTPAHSETAAQIGNCVERIIKRLDRLADD